MINTLLYKFAGVLVFLIFCISNGVAQDSSLIDYVGKDSLIAVKIRSARFQGGDISTFRQWVNKNINYPAEAVTKGISGKVIVEFVIDSNGNLIEPKILQSTDTTGLLDQEALRVISMSPPWTPAETAEGSYKIKEKFSFPMVFNLGK